jgi:hypothetical protein
MYPYNHKRGQRIQTNVDGVAVDRGFVAHVQVAAEDAVAESTTGVLAATALTAAAQEITDGLTSPAWPRNVQIVGNAAGIDGTVEVTGKNIMGVEISEEITANGATPKEGAKAFASITKVALPTQTHTPTKQVETATVDMGAAQVETATVTAGASGAGTLVVTVTAVGMTNSPKAVNVAVTADDDEPAEVGAAIRAAFELDEDVSGFFDISGEGANVVLTALTKAANDATMGIVLTDADGTGVTLGASDDTVAGVAPVIAVAGDATVTVTAEGLEGGSKAISVSVAQGDTEDEVAEKIRIQLAADDDIAALFAVSGEGADVVLTALEYAANDDTLNIALEDDTCDGINTAATSTATAAGVPVDTISVGWGDKLGLPYKLPHNTVLRTYLDNVLEATDPAVTTDKDNIEGNTIDLESALGGSVVDIYLIV